MDPPRPRADELLIEVEVCGVCHTDLHLCEGDLPLAHRPLVPGHQIVGKVVEAGAHARHAVESRVGVTWLASTCGLCEFCRSGRENLCRQARFTGWHVDGGYAERAVVRDAFAHELPPDASGEQIAPLLCAGVIGYRALRLAEIESGRRVGLFGFGASAHLALQVARHLGCEVYVFTRSREHQQQALSLGAVWAGNSKDEAPVTMHSSVVFAPVGEVVVDALNSLERGGTLAINAVHMTPLPSIDYERLYHERTLRSVANCTREDARELLRLAVEIPLRAEVEIHPLEKANHALQRVKSSKIQGAAVLRCQTGAR
jgi:propanol-preferring alcohol dehydrogenase